jgi:hypothetical protein
MGCSVTAELYILSALRHKQLWDKYAHWLPASVFVEKEHRQLYLKIAILHKKHPELDEISKDQFESDLPAINLLEAQDVVEDFAVRHEICNINIKLLNISNSTSSNSSTKGKAQSALLTKSTIGTIVQELQKGLDKLGQTQDRTITLAHAAQVKRWPTGIDLFDRPLEGGLTPGEMFLLGAAPKAGKTHWLTTLATAYERQGHDVIDFKFEDIPSDVLKYYTAAMGREKLEASLGNTLLLLDCSKEPTNLSTVYGEVEKAIGMESHGKPPVVVIDYADLLSGSGDAEAKRFMLTDIFIGLRRLANYYQAILLTATQGTAKMWNIKYPTLEDGLSEAKIGKAGTADVICLWSQLLEERDRGDGRLIFAGTRGRTCRQTVFPVNVDWSNFTIKER